MSIYLEFLNSVKMLSHVMWWVSTSMVEERSRNTAVEMSKEAKMRLDIEFTQGNKRYEKVMNSDRPIYLCDSSILFWSYFLNQIEWFWFFHQGTPGFPLPCFHKLKE